MPRFVLILALVVGPFSLAAQHAEVSAGDVIIRTTGNRVLVLVDTIVDRTGAPDGLIDQWYTLETTEPPAPVMAHLANALLVHSPAALRISTTDERYELVLRDARPDGNVPDSITTRIAGIGLSHNNGQTSISIASQLDRRGNISSECDECGALDSEPGTACSSGGPGSTSCSVASGNNSCSVTCATGYYACCNGIAGDTSCRCVRN